MKKTAVVCAMLILALAASACAYAEAVSGAAGSTTALREQPGQGSRAIGQFYNGAQLQMLSQAGDGWALVAFGGVQGYMPLEALSSGVKRDETLTASVVSPYGTPSVVLRDRPSDSYNAVAMVTVGSQVRVLGTSGKFVFVTLNNGTEGCLSSQEIR